ncbi:type II secretion protein F [Alsobacter soli]|uniref:Type II secretion protein F n=1 Tax=Alsobacter soli TaxID=2109933 RepID=A0A2T1HQ37_9HYPH|nr:type II secretion system F family protein [Alsobacter soli]PSC03753.1 type II secretion protein F [Alsobacter soli]
MDPTESDLAGAVDTDILLGVGLAVLVLAALGAVLWTLLRVRRQVRRRAAADTAEAAPREGGTALARISAAMQPMLDGADPREQRALRQRLIQAGFHASGAPALFFAARFGGAIGGALLTFLALWLTEAEVNTLLWTTAAAGAGYFAPNVYLNRIISKRLASYRIGFPDFMDLMVVCAEAGLPLEAAIDRISRELVQSYPWLAENLAMVSLEIRAGTPMADALNRLGLRLGLEEAMTFAALLQQSTELGASLSQSLRVYSDEMRHKRMSRAEEKAYALPAKLVVPLTVFVFPVLIVTLLYPAGVRIMASFANQ